MDTANLLSLVEDLEENIDDLEEKLEPLLSSALNATTKKLPLLDKAKLYVLIVYALESLIFSYLRLNGVNAKEHAIFKELTRVKQYFEKIKAAEEPSEKPKQNLSLDRPAAARFIKHALSGNEKRDLERAEREAKERLMAKRREQMLERQKSAESDSGGHGQPTELEGPNDQDEDGGPPETVVQQVPSTISTDRSKGKKKDQSRERRPDSSMARKAEKMAMKRKRKQERRENEGGHKAKRKKTPKGEKQQTGE